VHDQQLSKVLIARVELLGYEVEKDAMMGKDFADP